MMRKLRFSKGQLDRASEILGNFSIVWFSAGVISPLFIRQENLIDFTASFIVSLIVGGFFAFLSIYLMKGVK